MQEEKHTYRALIIYMFSLLLMVIGNLIEKIDLISVIYLMVVVCCIFKALLIIRSDGK